MFLSALIELLAPLSVTGQTDRVVTGVSHDSRQIGVSDVFVAIPGAQADGRRFARGLPCAAVVSERPVEGAHEGATLIVVKDARWALARLAAALEGEPGRALPVVGVTGTNGKTTTTFLVEAIAGAAGLRSGRIGTTGHRIAGRDRAASHTTPEAPVLQRLLAEARDAGCALVAMEVSSIGVELERVAAIPFRVAVFTNLTRDHLDFHGTMEAYAAAKARLFHELLDPGGTAILNGMDPAAAAMRPPHARTWTFGRGAPPAGQPPFDLCVDSIELRLGGCRAWVRTPNGEGQLDLQLTGLHNLDNALAALGVGLALGIPLERCLAGLAGLPSVPGRLEAVGAGLADETHGLHVFVDYAHTPDALVQVLGTLRPLTEGRILTVFGCGGDRDAGKRPLMGAAASAGSDHVYLTSDNPRSEDPAAILEQIAAGVSGPATIEGDRARAIEAALQDARPGDVVLIAGKGHERTQTVGKATLPFDDHAVAARLLAELPGPLPRPSAPPPERP